MPIRNYTQLRTHPDTKKIHESKQSESYLSTVTSMCGWRKTMQDADIIQLNIDGQGTCLFAIFDGHGGGQIAIYAKRHFVELLVKNQNFQQKKYEKALVQVFQKIDDNMMTSKGCQQVFAIKEQLQSKIRKLLHIEWNQDSDEEIECLAGTTALVCLVTKQKIYLASLGDSRCIISFNGTFKELSIQHKPDLPEEKARIQAAGGKVKNHRVNGLLGMSRSLGDFQFKIKKGKSKYQQMVITEPHIESIPNQNIEFILMGCDGVWEGKQEFQWYYQTVKEHLEKRSKHQTILEEILDTVIAKDINGDDGFDNMTALLVTPKSKLTE